MQLRRPPRQPARPAAYVQDVVRWRNPHFLQHRQRDGQVILLHPLAPPCLRPAIKFLPQVLGFADFTHLIFPTIHCPWPRPPCPAHDSGAEKGLVKSSCLSFVGRLPPARRFAPWPTTPQTSAFARSGRGHPRRPPFA